MVAAEVSSAMRRHLVAWEPSQSLRSALTYFAVGGTTTAAYLELFALLRAFLPDELANACAMLATTAINSALHRRYTFGFVGRGGHVRTQFSGFAGLVISFACTSLAVGILDLLDDSPSTPLSMAVVLLGTITASWVRFGPLRYWVGKWSMRPAALHNPWSHRGGVPALSYSFPHSAPRWTNPVYAVPKPVPAPVPVSVMAQSPHYVERAQAPFEMVR